MKIDIDIGYDKRKPLFQNVKLNINNCKIVNIIGDNGTGKSTFYKTLVGAISPLRGYISKEIIDSIAIVSPFTSMPNELNIEDLFELLDNQKLNKAINNYNEIYSHIKKYKKQTIKTLSTGQLRLAEIFFMLANKKNIIILDEAENGLDIHSKKDLLDQIKILHKKDITIFHTSHNLEDIVLLEGEIFVLDKYKNEFQKYNGKNTVEDISSFMREI